MELLVLGASICLYLIIAAYVLAVNVARVGVRVLLDVLEALVWPLALLPWREWRSSGRHSLRALA